MNAFKRLQGRSSFCADMKVKVHSIPNPSEFEIATINFCFNVFLLRYAGRINWLKQVCAIGNLERNSDVIVKRTSCSEIFCNPKEDIVVLEFCEH